MDKTCLYCGVAIPDEKNVCDECQRNRAESQTIKTDKRSFFKDYLGVASGIFGFFGFISVFSSVLTGLLFIAAAYAQAPVIRRKIAAKLNKEDFHPGLRFATSCVLFIVCLSSAPTPQKEALQQASTDTQQAVQQQVEQPPSAPAATPVPAKTSKPTPAPTEKPKAEEKVDDAGPKPENSAWDGSVLPVKRWLKANLPDPDSTKDEEWWKVVPTKAKDGLPCWGVRAQFRTKNQFGAYELVNMYFHIRHDEVIEVTQ